MEAEIMKRCGAFSPGQVRVDSEEDGPVVVSVCTCGNLSDEQILEMAKKVVQ